MRARYEGAGISARQKDKSSVPYKINKNRFASADAWQNRHQQFAQA